MSSMRTAITNARAAVLLTTAVAILAVDFVIFPRRFAKTETYGSSLMDGGVGLFTALMGFMSPEARGKNSASSFGEKVKQLGAALLSSSPLIMLGMGRAISVKAIDYQEHVSEYGVHWNFFFTLAVVKIISSGVLLVVSPSLCGVLAGVCPILYQHLLSSWGLSRLLQEGFHGGGPRHGWLDANREGIFSCLGYCSIYWAGVCVGQIVFLCNRKTVRDWLGLVLQFSLICAVLNILLVVCQLYVEPISRRFANMPYIIWMICALLQLLVTFMLEDIFMTVLQTFISSGKDKSDSVGECFPVHTANQKQCIMVSLNYNGLNFFLLANLLTGAVNMSVQTIYSTRSTAIIIVTVYMFVLMSASTIMHNRNLRVKFW